MKAGGDEEKNDEDDCCNDGGVVSAMVSLERTNRRTVLLLVEMEFLGTSISCVDVRGHGEKWGKFNERGEAKRRTCKKKQK